ncbi:MULTISPECIES: helix-turn-helix domain-containing protein [unclassified Imperialibacter]|uniref:helix-turn-helix domain-containing protein n=1 Tax=unclassified Imperialibacter TaxID=2629706 RepID=UPI0012525634|nr:MULTISPECIES: AraC family transcriptional regulator [unclassified Imperialibacter]CAD5266378.1 Transcriptional regulator, AraC family [Imperialibacter sp. 75]CAD5292153.1 Transcriptional regulator, AraC family [Imperialibacter sp. 89]VVT17972.1 Transcriptional regulator, AraC family [Imperialibacter sp. EC-SDR9]
MIACTNWPAKVRTYCSQVPESIDHTLSRFTGLKGAEVPAHITGLGVVVAMSGEATFRINTDVIVLNETSFLVVNKGSKLSITLERDDTLVALLCFDTTLSKLLYNGLIKSGDETAGWSAVSEEDFSLVEHLHFMNASLREQFQLLMELGNSCASFHSLKADMVVRSILDSLISENHHALQISEKLKVVKTVTKTALYKRLAAAREWIINNCQQPIDLQQAADVAMLDKQHFLRLFKRAYQITPHNFLTRMRLERAEKLLEETDLAVSDICRAVGFDSIPSFTSLFKRTYGEAPGRYRRKMRLH